MKIPQKFDEALLASAENVVEERMQALVAAGALATTDEDFDATGNTEFVIDLLVPEEWETGDGRTFKADSITAADFPMTLFWQPQTAQGHNGSVIVGRIEYAERLQTQEQEEGSEKDWPMASMRGWGNARGVFDSKGVFGAEAERLNREGFLRGISVDLDQFGATVQQPVELAVDVEDGAAPAEEVIEADKIEIQRARIRGATMTGMPAFQECVIRIPEPEVEILELEDGIYEEASDDMDDVYAAITASAAPMVPPRSWFQNQHMKQLTPITVTDDGQVFGHIASWNSAHIGMAGKVRPPRSRSDYKYFRTGVVRTDDGTDVTVGQLTLAGGHASVSLNAAAAVKHYDDTASAVVDVNVGEDAHGIWVAGALRPEATPAQIRALRASAPSGDWRPINGRLELVAACCVNVPGFPVPRAMVASAGGTVTALLAAGASAVAELRNPIADLEDRIKTLETLHLQEQRAEILSLMEPVVTEHDEALVASADEVTQFFNKLEEDRLAALQEQADDIKKSFNLE